MSEELQSKYIKDEKITGQKICDFEYFQIGATTFNQLKQAKIIPSFYNKKYDSKKPDRLIVDRRNKIKPIVVAVVEDKQGGKFTSDKEKQKAIRQCNNYCQELKAKIGIITDGSVPIWINPNEKNKDNEYLDKTMNEKRSFSFIRKEDGTEIVKNFIIKENEDILDIQKASDETRILYNLIHEIIKKTNIKNSIIKQPEKIDPLPLARRVWQNIWVATGKSPEKCLYNVVELFIFKFLSDLKILEEPENFEYLLKLTKSRDNKDVLNHYAKVCRSKIEDIFPPSQEDGTTIINGTIFVNEDGEPNFGQATLFCNSLKKFKDFEKEQGTFEHIDKEFKTKLFETFLKQSEGQKALGQYFTPRKVVRAIVNISGIGDLKQGARFCDPFCGVGGFVLEPINLYRLNDFQPKNDEIITPITYFGFDKGFEKDEERTIILAKANMLLYLAEIISKNPTLTKKFAQIFNKVFRLWQSNLGTLEHIFYKEDEKFDLILTNPPYVRSGSATLKYEIKENADLKKFYSINAGGTEGLALEWIIRSLKKRGKAFVVIPNGILKNPNDKKMRKFILDECYLEGVISLPVKTFFLTSTKTYILAITKKENSENKQDFPVFTYLVSNIGETLDVNRFEIPKNDLNEAVKLYKAFQANKKDKDIKKDLEKQSKRCKIQSLKKFEPEKYWSIDRWWLKEEKIELGIEEEEQLLSVDEFFEELKEAEQLFKKSLEQIQDLKKKSKFRVKDNFKKINILYLYEVQPIKNKLTKSEINKNNHIPVYSSQYLEKGLVGYTNKAIYDDCSPQNTYITFGDHTKSVFIRTEPFSVMDNVKVLNCKDEFRGKILEEFILLTWKKIIPNLGYSRHWKEAKNIIFSVPVNENGEFDLKAQQKLFSKNKILLDIQEEINLLKEKIENVNISFDEDFENKEVEIGNILDFPETNSKVTKAFCIANEGDIPVYASSKSETSTLGHIKDNLKNVKYYKNCLSWNRNGSVGYVFIRNHRFATNEDHRAMTIKEDLKNSLDKNYLKYEIEKRLFLNDFSFLDKCGVSKIKKVGIKIPVVKSSEFNLEKQKEIAQKYEKIEELKKELTEKLDLLSNYKISLE